MAVTHITLGIKWAFPTIRASDQRESQSFNVDMLVNGITSHMEITLLPREFTSCPIHLILSPSRLQDHSLSLCSLALRTAFTLHSTLWYLPRPPKHAHIPWYPIHFIIRSTRKPRTYKRGIRPCPPVSPHSLQLSHWLQKSLLGCSRPC